MSADPTRRVLWTFLLGLLLTATAQAGEPELVRDLRPGSAQGQGAIDSRFITARSASGILFFGASDPAHGMELWRTDGTPQGTFRLTDVCPGRCGSLPDALQIFVFNGEVYFGADDGVSGRELWASGDTPGTSRRVRDLCPGPCNGSPSQLAVVGNRLYFEALLPGGSRGLWISDGSRRGTTLLRELCHEYYEETDCTYRGIVEAGGLALFQRSNTTLGVWRSDGTAEGTGPFSDVVEDFPSPATLIPTGGGAAFAWSEDGLWWTDGTVAGTRRLKTVAELGIVADPSFLGLYIQSTIWRGKLFSNLGTFLVRSDGTPEGTVRFGEISSYVSTIQPLDDALLLVASDGGVWRTQGTAETTTGPTARLPDDPYLTDLDVVGNRLAACIQQSGGDPVETELWVSDGTIAGTQRLEGTDCTYLSSVTADRLAFSGDLRRLQRTDGTPSGTSDLRDFGTALAGSGPLEQLAWKGRLLFSAQTSDVGAPLFLSDGTPPGTHEVAPGLDAAGRLARAGNRVFFQASELVHEDGYDWLRSLGLWKTDGSAAGTVQVHPSGGYYSFPMPVGGALFFASARASGYYGEPDTELFRSDGTLPGTGLVKNINRFTSEGSLHHACYDAPSDPGPGIELGGRLIFAADDGLRGRELWESTGTRAGTSLLRDIDPRRLDGPPPYACDSRRSHTGLGSDPRGFVRFANGVLFTAIDGPAGRELWWTDGTAAGTRRVSDIRPGGQGSEPHDLVLFRGRVWFVASSEGKGEELWRTDGTRRGTVRIRRLDVAALPARAWSLTVVGDQLFFVLTTEAAGPELWVSGGTAASTHRVLDVRPGPEGSYPQSLTEAHGLLVFAAADGTHGLEAWRSDGTAEGTFLLGDVNPGFDASAPGPFTPIAGGLVLSGADDGEHGRELWAYPVTGEP